MGELRCRPRLFAASNNIETRVVVGEKGNSQNVVAATDHGGLQLMRSLGRVVTPKRVNEP